MGITRSYNGFSGVEITAQINERKYADLQAVCFTPFRDMAPIYTMGDRPMPPHRGIHGVLIFVKFYHPEPVKTFDIRVRAANEHGQEAIMTIRDVEIWEDGLPWSPHQMYETERHYTYFAKSAEPWKWTADRTPCYDWE